jgi:hypothetical protein
MTDPIAKRKTPDECAVFAKNVADRGCLDLAVAARKRARELRALDYGATTEVEREFLEAVFPYEEFSAPRTGGDHAPHAPGR